MVNQYPFTAFVRSLLLTTSMLFSPVLLAEEPPSTISDTLKLTDGSVLSGELLSGAPGVIHFRSQDAGNLSIAISRVVELSSAQAVIFKTTDGAVIRLPAVTIGREPIKFVTESGAAMYSLTDINTINPEPWMLGEGYHWTGALILALEIQSGNTDKQELDMDLHSVWRRGDTRYTLRASGELDKANEVKTSDDYTVIAKSDRFLSDTTYAGANLYVEADELAELKRRVMLSGYYGKQWRSKPRFRFSTEPGLAYVLESRTELDQQKFFAFSWNMDMHSNYLGPNTDSYLRQVGVWNLEDSSDLVVNTRIGIRMPVRPKITVNTELKLEYDSGAPEDIEELDQTFTIGFGYRW